VTLCAVLVGAGVAVWQARTAAAARDAARGEAAKAAAISTFLEQTLLAAGPTVGAGVRASDLRVVDVLRPAAERAQTAFPDQPDVRAAILYTVGRTYLDLGLWSEAERATMAALALRDSLHGRRPHLDRIQSADEAARLAKMRNAERDALGWGARALAMRQQLHGAESLSAAEGLGRYADLLAWFGHFDDAFARHREALALADRVGQSRAPEAADIRLSFALLHLQTGQVAAADSVLGQLERFTRGTDTATRALGLHYRAGAALFLGEIGRAERLNAVARRALEARFEASHPLLNEARGIHAALLVERGRFAEAERIMRSVAEAFEASLGGTTRYEVHLARAEWGAALAGLGRTADAERLLRPATDRLRASIGDGNPWTRHQAAHLADLYDRLGRPADARRYRQVATAP
jgi:serine/threonine-protein kinase